MSPKLSVPGPPDIPDEIDPSDFPVPFEGNRRTPPMADPEDPTVDLSDALDPGTADSPGRIRQGHFTALEVQLVLQLRAKGCALREIARRIGRSHEGVRLILQEWEPTAELAKATLQKGAATLAERVVAQADVDQSLEVLDRLSVLPKRDKGADNRVQVMVGLTLEDPSPMKVLDITHES